MTLQEGPLAIKRIFYLITLRAIIIVCSGIALIILDSRHINTIITLSFAFLLNLSQLFLYQLVNKKFLMIASLVADSIFVSALVYFTGIDRLFFLLNFLIVIAAALIVGAKFAIFCASFCTLLLSVISILYHFASRGNLALPFVAPEIVENYGTNITFLLTYLTMFAISIHIVGFLSGQLILEIQKVRIVSKEMLETIDSGVLAIDRFGNVSFINKKAASMLGKDSIHDYKSLKNPEIKSIINESLEGREIITKELELNGLPIELSTSPIIGKAGFRGIIITLRDLTLRKRLESMTIIEERFNALREISSALAHEIRNPLSSIKGAAEQISNSRNLKISDTTYINLLVNQANRLDRIISDFLEYAQNKPIELKLCNISQILEEVCLLLEMRAKSKEIYIVREFPSTAFCRGDQDKLLQAFLNIGLNAIEAIQDKGTITVRCEASKGISSIEFIDNGPGLNQEAIRKIFEPFFTTKRGGTGMGLPIAKKIISAHSGHIQISSELGKGTKCIVTLPN